MLSLWGHRRPEAGASRSLRLAPSWLQARVHVSAGATGEPCGAEQLPATTNSIVRKPGMKFIAYFTVLKVCV